MPEGDGGCSAGRNGVIFCNRPTAVQHPLKVSIAPVVLPLIIDGKVDFVIDFPAPSIVVHGAHVDVPAICEVDLGVKQSFLGLEDVDAFEDEPLEEHVVEDVAEDWLVALS